MDAAACDMAAVPCFAMAFPTTPILHQFYTNYTKSTPIFGTFCHDMPRFANFPKPVFMRIPRVFGTFGNFEENF